MAVRRIKQARYLMPRLFVALGKLTRRPVLAAMHGAAAQAVKLLRGINHHLRLERCGGAVEINTGVAQRGKLLAEGGGIECGHALSRHTNKQGQIKSLALSWQSCKSALC